MQEIFQWVVSNKEWFLSGIGISLPLAIVGWWFKPKDNLAKQMQKSGNQSVNIQAAGNITIGTATESDTVRVLKLKELSEFREKIHASALKWERLLQMSNDCAKNGDTETGSDALMQSAAALNEIVSAFRLNRHLFDTCALKEIDGELEVTDSKDSLTHLIKAIQLINEYSEKNSNELNRQNA